MSSGARPTRRRNRPGEMAPRRVFTVYTWMLILALIFTSIATWLLFTELMKYGFTWGSDPPWQTQESKISQLSPEKPNTIAVDFIAQRRKPCGPIRHQC